MTGINWSEWGLDAPAKCAAVHGGLINTSLRAEWPNGTARLVQRVNSLVFQDLKAIEANLQLALEHPIRHLAVLPVLRLDGRIHSEEGWRIFPWVEQVAPEPQDVKELGAFWGRFDAELNSNTGSWSTVLPEFHSAARRWAQWNTVRHVTPDSRLSLRGVLESFAPSMLELERKLPDAVQHHDAKRSNVLFSVNGIRAIDLDTVQVGYLGSDFADLVRSTAALRAEDDPEENAANPEAFEAVWEGYAAEWPSVRTHAMLVRKMPSYLTWVQALRFATDAASGDKYYRTTHEGQNWQRAQNQLELAQSLIFIS